MNLIFVAKRGFTISEADLAHANEMTNTFPPIKGDRIALQTGGSVTALYEVTDRDFIVNRQPHGDTVTVLLVVLRPMVLPHSP